MKYNPVQIEKYLNLLVVVNMHADRSYSTLLKSFHPFVSVCI